MVEAFLLQTFVLEQRAPRIAEEIGQREAEVAIAVVSHVSRARLFQSRCDERLGIAAVEIIGAVGGYENGLPVIAGNVHKAVDIEVGNGCEGEVNTVIVGPEVDAVFAIVECHMYVPGLDVNRFPADNGQCVVGGVRHAGLHLSHHISEGLVVVALEDVFACVDRCCSAGAGQRILGFASGDYLNGGAGIYHLLEVADADIGHVGHVVVETEHHRALRSTFGIDNRHQAFAIILYYWFVGPCYGGVCFDSTGR